MKSLSRARRDSFPGDPSPARHHLALLLTFAIFRDILWLPGGIMHQPNFSITDAASVKIHLAWFFLATGAASCFIVGGARNG